MSTIETTGSRSWLRSWSALALAFGCSCAATAADHTSSVPATGLNKPRGLAFGPDGALYITEAGIAAGSGPSTLIRREAHTDALTVGMHVARWQRATHKER